MHDSPAQSEACALQYSLHQIQRILRQRKTSLKRRAAIVHDLPVVIFRHKQELATLPEAQLRVRSRFHIGINSCRWPPRCPRRSTGCAVACAWPFNLAVGQHAQLCAESWSRYALCVWPLVVHPPSGFTGQCTRAGQHAALCCCAAAGVSVPAACRKSFATRACRQKAAARTRT